jgi:hypothetical protein
MIESGRLIGAAWGVEHSGGIWKLSDEQTILPMRCGAGSLPRCVAVLFYQVSCGGMRQTRASFLLHCRTAPVSSLFCLRRGHQGIGQNPHWLGRAISTLHEQQQVVLLHASQRKCSLKLTDSDLHFELRLGREARARRPDVSDYCPHLTFCPFRIFLAHSSWYGCTERPLAMLE